MQPVSMLEIGLGCDMKYGPGKSLDLWTTYFPHKSANITFMEYDKECSQKFQDNLESRARIFAGDQSSIADLSKMIEHFGIHEYDFIIDDGGHKMQQQITSLVFLFKYLKPGGLYFLEDLQTSYIEYYGGGYKREGTAIEFIKSLIDELYLPSLNSDLISMIESIDCYHEICVFTKKK